jgi:hypothetical protein
MQMEANLSSREELHQLVDHLPEGHVPAASKILRSLVDPVELSLLNASLDDEPESEAERQAVEKALNDPRPRIPLDEVLREFGMTS